MLHTVNKNCYYFFIFQHYFSINLWLILLIETYANAQITFFDTPSLNCLRLHPRYCCSSRIRNACPGLCFAYPCNTPSAIKNFSINNASLLHHWNSQINKKPRQILPQNQILSSRKPLLQPQPQPPQGIVLPPVDTDLAKETQHSISFLESKKIQKKIEPPLQEQNNNLHSSTFGFFEAVQESIDLDNVNKQKITSMTRFPTLIPWTPTTTTSINSLISIEKIAPKSNLMPRDMNAAVDGEFRKKNENEQILLSRKNKMAGILEPPESSLISFGEASNDYATVKSEEQVSETTDIINVKNFENIPPIPTPPGTTWIPLIFNIKASDLNSSEAVRTTVDTPSVKTNTVNIVSALREIETELQGSISENQLSKIGITTKNPMYINVRDTEKIESQESKINNQKIEKSSEYINETDLILNASTKTKQIESRHNEPFIISSSFKRREDLPIPSEEKSIHFWEMRNNKLVKITSSKNGTQLEEGIGLFGNKINVIIDRLVTQETIDAINSIAGKKLKHQRQNEYTTKTTIIQFPPSHVPNIFVKSNEICGKAPDFHPCVLLSDANSRLVNCCKNKLLPEGCLKLCRYDTTQAEIKKEFDAGRCGILNVGPFLECASEDEDNIDCCRHQDIAKKSGPQCEVFCQPKRGLGILSLRHLSCQNVIGELLKCHHAGLRPR